MFGIGELLVKIRDEFPKAKLESFAEHRFKRESADHFQEITSGSLWLEGTNILTTISFGQGQWSDVPWMSFLNTLVTDSTQRGYYVVYLISADMKELYLCLGQGVDSLKQEFGRSWREVLEQRSQLIRLRLGKKIEDYETRPFDLRGSSDRSKSYGLTPAFYKRYDLFQLPEERVLIEDLRSFLVLYDVLILEGGPTPIEEIDLSQKKADKISVSEAKKRRLHYRLDGRVNSDKVKEIHGFTCRACGFDFQEFYGSLGEGYIECHHLVPYSELGEGEVRKLDPESDFVVLCANCHSMIHRMDDVDDIQGLVKLISNQRN